MLSSTKEEIIKAGTEAIVVSDAFEKFEGLIKNIVLPDSQRRRLTLESLLQIFQAHEPAGNYANGSSAMPLISRHRILLTLGLGSTHRAQRRVLPPIADGKCSHHIN